MKDYIECSGCRILRKCIAILFSLLMITLFTTAFTSSAYAQGRSDQVQTGEMNVIDYMDIGNVWTDLSPIYGIPFTTMFDREGILQEQVQIIDQYWKDTASGKEIHAESKDLPESGHSYEFYITLKPQAGYTFSAEKFETFIFEGSPVAADQYEKTLHSDGTVTMHWGYVKKAAEGLSKVSLLTPKVGRQYVTVKWKMGTSGVFYQVGYRQKGSKTWKYTTSKTTSKTIKKLKSRKYYYVKVREYKTVGKVKHYGAWSASKRVKIK